MPCPVFDHFVAGIAGGDLSLEYRIWEVLGYYLTQDQRGKCFVVLQGPPDSGKSLFGNFLRECFNKEAVSSLDLHSFGSTFALADIIGKRLCIDLDLPAGSVNSRAASILKKMTGGDMLSASIKYMPSINFINTAKFFFASNHAVIPHIRDEAFLKRLVVVPFFFSVPEDVQDRRLGEKLAAERDGVIAKALHFYIALRDRNYRFTGHFPANMAVMGYDDSSDCLIRFLREECEEMPQGWVSTQELYTRFCRRFGERWAMNVFSGRMNDVLMFAFPGARKMRSRISGSGNPIGGFYGMVLKNT